MTKYRRASEIEGRAFAEFRIEISCARRFMRLVLVPHAGASLLANLPWDPEYDRIADLSVSLLRARVHEGAVMAGKLRGWISDTTRCTTIDLDKHAQN